MLYVDCCFLLHHQEAHNPKAEEQLTAQHKDKMAALLEEVEQQLLSQHQQLYGCDAGLSYLRNKSELCAEHAKV